MKHRSLPVGLVMEEHENVGAHRSHWKSRASATKKVNMRRPACKTQRIYRENFHLYKKLLKQ